MLEKIAEKKQKTTLIATAILLLAPLFVFSDIDDIRNKIYDTQASIATLEDEIKAEQAKIDSAQKEAKTLQSAVNIINAEIKKTDLQIKSAESKIHASNLEIEELSDEISGATKSISNGSLAIADLIRNLNRLESESFIESMLNHKKVSDVWATADSMAFVSFGLKNGVSDLKTAKENMEALKRQEELKKKELLALKAELADRRKIADLNKKEKDNLLKLTKNQEANYKKIMAEKLALKEAFERELLEFESELQLMIDPSSIPTAGKGVLKWPLDVIRITQKFGRTDFSDSRPGLYATGGHNGVDFGVPVGTPVKASLSGVVEGTGDTDLVCPGASYGKWVLIKHNNGLTTLYAHLSLIKASKGDSVSTGEIIGYSGNTGYSTGPHLHFTVYASQGVEVMSRPSKACKGTYTMPVADLRAYLDPLEYL